MKTRWIAALMLSFVFSAGVQAQISSGPQGASTGKHTFAEGTEGKFVLDGKPFQIRAGEMHYPRVPRAEWHDRMKKLKAMGLNTLTTYVFWNLHETSPGHYDFSGQNDLAEYLRTAQEEGLYVILRPGPYVCAEWEFGGYPSWLLKNHSIVVRSSDSAFMTAVRSWFMRLGQVVSPLLLANGGPIIAVQVENEYGSFGDDHVYMENIKGALKASGMGDGYLYTADGADLFAKGGLPELPAVVNFGPGEAQEAFASLKKRQPDGSMMSGEYWAGWFDHWGEAHQTRPDKLQEDELKWMLDRGYSFNLYMAEGGTSFGWMNGANSNGTNFEPDTTSYDYDAPIDERGAMRPKYFVFRDLIRKATGVTPPDPPATAPVVAYPVQRVTESASLWESLPPAIHSDVLLSMEDVDQAYGYILYTRRLTAHPAGRLQMDAVHDYASVYLDHVLIGTADRRLGQNSIELPVATKESELEILVENSGRVNFTKVLRTERKGITSQVTLAGVELSGWDIYPLPMESTGQMKYAAKPCTGPCFFRTQLEVGSEKSPQDTYLDTTGMNKGMVWANGRALGRAWDVGPQGALYLPASWLHGGANEIDVFELNAKSDIRLKSVDHPIFFSRTATASVRD